MSMFPRPRFGCARPVHLAAAVVVLSVLAGVAVWCWPTATASAQAPACPTLRVPGLVIGSGPDGRTDGPGVILAFEHAYYTLRAADAARELLTPDTGLPTTPQMQAGIDQLPAHTHYCAQITTLDVTDPARARWRLHLTEHTPTADRTLRQVVTTRTEPGTTARISAITAA